MGRVGACSPEALRALAAVVGDRQVVTDAERTARYARDWTGRFAGTTPAVVRPADAAEVAGVVRVCREHGVALVPQGGNTGLVGGGVPLDGEVVLALERLRGIEVDEPAGQLTAGAGSSLAAVQAAAADVAAAYAVDLAARDAATVGGTVATNAGGHRVLRWGATREQVAGVEAVLGDGSLVRHLAGLRKDNTGYDLAGLLCGSEGTLAVVTAARLRLVPRFEHRTAALVGFTTLDAAISAAGVWRAALGSVDAIELLLASGLELVCGSLDLAPPLAGTWPAYLLVEAADHEDPTEALGEVVAATAGVGEVAVAPDEREVARLWRYREAHTEAINLLGPPHKLDVTLPAAALSPFIGEVPAAVASVAPDARVWLFGHAGDGNVHVNVSGVAPGDERVDDVVLRLVASWGGSISAEHGIGTAKKRWLHLNRSAEELAAFGRIKRALDPDGILNPNVLLS